MGRAIAQGFLINWVSILAFQSNKIDRMARVYTSNKNSQLRPLEAARGFKRFRGPGLDSTEIAASVHFSRTHVENYLVLPDAQRDARELVRSCQVADTLHDIQRHRGQGYTALIRDPAEAARRRHRTRRTTAKTLRRVVRTSIKSDGGARPSLQYAYIHTPLRGAHDWPPHARSLPAP